jgi:gluconokinase
MACSALKKAYRSILSGGGHDTAVQFVFLDGSRETLLNRVSARQGHYMKADMAESQIEALERPSPEEAIVVNIDDGRSSDAIVGCLVERFLAPAERRP